VIFGGLFFGATSKAFFLFLHGPRYTTTAQKLVALQRIADTDSDGISITMN
jgi:hypothetical protein